MECEGSLPYSQKLAIGHYPQKIVNIFILIIYILCRLILNLYSTYRVRNIAPTLDVGLGNSMYITCILSIKYVITKKVYETNDQNFLSVFTTPLLP
jgi:hypothetical protein